VVCEMRFLAVVSGDCSARQLAKEVGVHPSTILAQMRRRGFRKCWELPKDAVDHVVDLLLSGFTYRQIQKETSVSKSSVGRIAKRHRISRPKPHRCKKCGAKIATECCLACSIVDGTVSDAFFFDPE
jgi:IS30 family transposase